MSGANFDELKHKRYTLRREWTLSHVHIPKFKDICPALQSVDKLSQTDRPDLKTFFLYMSIIFLTPSFN